MKPGLAEYTASLFQPLLGQVFLFREPRADGSIGMSAALELVAVNEPESGSKNRPAGLRAPFSLVLVLRTGDLRAGGLLRMEHPDLDPSDIFLSRVMVPGKHGSEKYYEAAFG